MPAFPTSVVAALPSLVPFVAPEALEKQLGLKFRLRLGANESTFGPSPHAVTAMAQAASHVQNYGDPQNIELRDAIAHFHGMPAEQIAVGVGIDGLLVQFCQAYLDPSRVVVTSLGGYATFDYAAVGTGAQVLRVPYRDDKPDLEGIVKAAVDSRASVVYVANPDNPSGWRSDSSEISKFAAQLPPDCLLLLDEAYAEFGEPETPLAGDRVVRFRTFSKAYGMAGLRLGYAICGGDQAAIIDRIRPHFEVSSIAQSAGIAALSDQEHVRSVVRAAQDGIESIRKIALSHGYRTLPSRTNFVLIDVSTADSASALLNRFLANAVFVRKPSRPPLDRCVRITTSTAAELELLADLWPK